MTVSPVLVTATGFASMLEEPDHRIQVAALEKLDQVVDEFWPEIADYIPQIESLYEDRTFPSRELAALVASKVFFHLEAYPDAIRLALCAGSKFQLTSQSDFTTTLMTKIVDEYVLSRSTNEGAEVDPRLSEFLERMFSHCLKKADLRTGMGIAIESRRLDWIRRYVESAQGPKLADLLAYCQQHMSKFISHKSLRSQVLEILVAGYHSTDRKDKDWAGAAQCLYLLNRPESVADLIDELLKSSASDRRDELIGLQLAFDVAEHDDQGFCKEVLSFLKYENSPMITQIRSVLSFKTQIALNLEFLFRNNKTDLLLVESLRTSIDQRSSVLHNGVVLAHALMQAGSTNDAFMRKNLDWLAKSSHWAKFTATASLGVVHKGHISDARKVLSAYLPATGQAGRSPYSEGGAFFALGLIHANHHDPSIEEYLTASLAAAQGNDVLQVGACLGLGLTCLATKSQNVYETLKNVLFLDSAVSGEAAAYSIGLVMAGSGNEQVIKDLLAYAHETQHEKIIRSCAVALALILFECEENADNILSQMTVDSDAIIRYGGMMATGMAYCGTSDNGAVKKLLHFSVSDVSDDVRRAAVMALGLVLSNEPSRLPKILKLLSQSYNPHVRYGACIALGIGCPGMAASVPESVALLEPLLSDVSEFVRQGALMSMGLVCQETSAKQVSGKAQIFRDKIHTIIKDKHEDVMCRFGAVLAHGLIDIGGRNASVPLFTKNGSLRMGAAVGFCLFTQMWYWYPLMLMVSLAISPTALIALNQDLKMPKSFSVKSKAKPSTFAYPADFKVESKEAKARLTSAVLSAAKGKKGTETEAKDTEMIAETAEKIEEETPEPNDEILRNPCRVVADQEQYISFLSNEEGARYHPVLPSRKSGYLVVIDSKPGEPEEFLEFGNIPTENLPEVTTTAPASVPASTEEEAPPPEEFEWEG